MDLEQDFFLDDIEPLNEALGFAHRARNVSLDSPLMSGEFRFHTFAGGLSMHAANAQELQDSDNVLALPSGLSFNLVFKGSVDFSFDNARYRMAANPKTKAASCTAIINSRDEILTRHMRKGVEVEKLNIFVEQKWLLARCDNPAQQQAIKALFEHHGVLQWQASPQLLQLAFKLLEVRAQDSYRGKLIAEQFSIALLAQCLSELEQQLQAQQHQAKQHSQAEAKAQAKHKELKQRIDQALPYCHSIAELADALNTSTRSLQRSFKQRYQFTVSDYVKQRRMELAKKAMLIDGLSIKEASYQAGYSYPSNFVSAFKKRYGLSPANYRKVHDNDSEHQAS